MSEDLQPQPQEGQPIEKEVDSESKRKKTHQTQQYTLIHVFKMLMDHH